MSDDQTAAIEQPAPPRFVSERPRFREVPLVWPVEYDGKVIDKITVHRLTAAEVAAFAESDDRATLPMFDVPVEVLDHLDDDDALEVNKAVLDFLPRRWRADEPPQPTSTTTSP